MCRTACIECELAERSVVRRQSNGNAGWDCVPQLPRDGVTIVWDCNDVCACGRGVYSFDTISHLARLSRHLDRVIFARGSARLRSLQRCTGSNTGIFAVVPGPPCSFPTTARRIKQSLVVPRPTYMARQRLPRTSFGLGGGRRGDRGAMTRVLHVERQRGPGDSLWNGLPIY